MPPQIKKTPCHFLWRAFLWFLSSISYITTAFTRVSGHRGSEIKILSYCTLYSTAREVHKSTAAVEAAGTDNARQTQELIMTWLDMWTHFHIFESLQRQGSYVGDLLCHKFSKPKQHKFIILQFWRAESPNQGAGRAVFSPGALSENLFPCLQLLEATCIPLLMVPSFIFQASSTESSNSSFFLSLYFHCHLLWLWPSCFLWDSCDYTTFIWMTYISRSLT